MKKKYTKPQIIIENFTMSTNIAGDCTFIIDNQSYQTCAYIDRSGNFIFTSDLDGVCTRVESDGCNDTVCYHVPLETNDLFNS